MVTGLWTEEVVKKAGVAVIWIDRRAERQKEGGGWSWSRKNAINGLKTVWRCWMLSTGLTGHTSCSGGGSGLLRFNWGGKRNP